MMIVFLYLITFPETLLDLCNGMEKRNTVKHHWPGFFRLSVSKSVREIGRNFASTRNIGWAPIFIVIRGTIF